MQQIHPMWCGITAASLKNMADLVEISTGQAHESGAEIWARFADSGAGFLKFGADG